MKIEQVVKLYRLFGDNYVRICHKEGYQIDELTNDCIYKFIFTDFGLRQTITPENCENVIYINSVLEDLYQYRFDMIQDLSIDVDYNILKLPKDKYIKELLKYV